MEDVTVLKDSSQLSPEESQKIEQKKDRFDRNFGFVISGFIILLAAFLIFVDVNTLQLTDKTRVLGPGAFPLLILIALILLLIWHMIELATGKGGSAKLESHISTAKAKKALRLYVQIVVCIFLLNYLGYIISVGAFTFVEMMFFAEKKVKLHVAIITTILIPVCIYAIFNFLNISLPSPIWMQFK